MQDIKIRLKRLRIYGIIGICYSLYLGYDYFFVKEDTIELVISICLLLASITFLLAPLYIKSHRN